MDRMDPAAIAALTLAERLRAMEMLWDSLSREDAPELSPDWHAPLLRQRRLDLATSPTSSLEDADARLRRLFGFD
jgi:hypothetical protein